MDDFAPENAIDDDFEVEIIDLPPGEMPVEQGRLDALALKSVQNLSSVKSHVRTLLRSSEVVQRERANDGLVELEVIDLPASEKPSLLEKLLTRTTTVNTRVRMRPWRVVLFALTLVLLIALLLNFIPPPVRTGVYHLFVAPTPTPTFVSYTDNRQMPPLFGQSQVRIFIIGTTGVTSGGLKGSFTYSGQDTWIKSWSADSMPGVPPQGNACPGRPSLGYSHEVGSTPIWLGGFTEPNATLHLYPTPVAVPAMPGGYAWTGSLLLRVQPSATGQITLDGTEMNTGVPLFLQIDPGQEPTTNVAFDPQSFTPDQPNKTDVTLVVTFYFSIAGCYDLTISWAGGQRNLIFAAGR